MIKQLFLFAILFCSFSVLKSQVVDTTILHSQLDSLFDVSINLSLENNFEEALKATAAAEKLILENFGKSSTQYATVCYRFGWTMKRKGDYVNAEKKFLESKAVLGQLSKKEEERYANCLDNLAEIYLYIGEFEQAESHFLENKALREKVFGKDHLKFAESIDRLAIFYYETGKYEKAELLYIEALTVREKAVGKEHEDYAQSMENLANLYCDIGKFENTDSLYFEVIRIREKTLGKENRLYPQALDNLAILNTQMGHYEKAMPLYEEAKQIRERVVGKEHLDYAASLMNLGLLHGALSSYEKAEPYYFEASVIREKTLGKQNPLYAHCLFSLGQLYLTMANYEKAQVLFEETEVILKNTLGVNHPYYGLNLEYLGKIHFVAGNYKKAEALYLETKTVYEKVYAKKNPVYLALLNSLGWVYLNIGNYEQAKILVSEVLTITENAFGKESIHYANSLDLKSEFLAQKGDYQKATLLSLESLRIKEKTFGKKHTGYGNTLEVLADRYIERGNYEKAKPLYLEAFEIKKSFLTKASFHLSEKELMAYSQEFADTQNRYLSLIQNHANFASLSYDNILFYKGFLLNSVKKINQLAISDTTSMENLLRLKSYQRRLAAEYAKPLEEREQLLILEEKTNKIEKELSRNVAHFGENIRQIQWQEIQANLKSNEVAIEFIHYPVYNLQQTDSTIYAVLIVKSGDEKPKLIPLFEEKRLKKLLTNKETRRAEYVNNLYVNEAKVLYNIILKPLEKDLADVKTIYYSPSGLLHLINLNAIPISENGEAVLSDKYEMQLLNSTRELVIKPAEKSNNFSAILFGGIHYESTGIAVQESNAESQNIASRSRGILEFSQIDSTLRGDQTWQYLESTQEEIEALAPILKKKDYQVSTQNSTAATEESFKTLSKTNKKSSPNIIHIATHGYFFPDPSQVDSTLGVGESAEPVFKMSDHPMIRSGLLFAGANHAWKTGSPLHPNMEDGILTAYEISQMNLSDTELVVLSACETGLGDIKGNEGVYGLQRAFKIAGVKNILMSLWQVPDYQTKELMVRFYTNWLEENMDIHQALLAAQHAMREEGYEPFHWAGFVLLK